MRYYAPLLIFLLFTTLVFGQKYSFVTYSTDEGLPQSQVTSIAQDNNGYLWVATFGGLAKFNGDRFIPFSSSDGLLNNRVSHLTFFENTLWVGHDGGVSFIREGKVKSIGFTGDDQSRKVTKILSFYGDIWVCSNGGGLHKLKNDKLISIKLDDKDYERIRGAYVLNETMYLATRGGVLATTDGVRFVKLENLPDLSYSGCTGHKNFLYFASYNSGVYRWNTETNEVQEFTAEQLKHTIFECYTDHFGKLWITSQEGAIVIDENDQIRFINSTTGLPVNLVNCFFEDSENNLWIGSGGKGIFRFPGEAFKYFDKTTEFGSDIFVGGFQDNDGSYYYATLDRGILKRNTDGTVEQIPLPSGQLVIWDAIKNIDGKDWFATQNSLVSIDKMGRIEERINEEGMPGGKITAFYRLSKDRMYIGGSYGAALYDKGELRRVGSDEFPIGTVRDFARRDGELFCATNLGIFKFEDGEFRNFSNLEYVAYGVEKDAEGNLWFGTEEGLFKYDGETVNRISLLRDPASNFINFLNYRDGKLLAGTNNGLFVLSDLHKPTPSFERYGSGEGIIDLECNMNSGFHDLQGNFWFGTASGLVCYHSNSLMNRDFIPRVQLNSILLNYQPFDYGLYSEDLDESGFPKSMSLPYSKNNLIFNLDGISLVNHRGLSYQFWLEGLNDEWSPLTDNPRITFTSLPAGQYSLKMRVVDVDGRISEEIVFPFEIRQAYYKTWWFILLCLIVASIFILLFFRARLRRVNEQNEKEKLEYKSRLLSLEQQSMNASMNRHFVFNSLNSIQYFINTRDRLSANKYLTDFAKLIRKNLDSATADGNMISLEEELERLQLYMSLEQMRFKDRFVYEVNVAPEVDTETTEIPAMIMQPFVENSIIHGILPEEDKQGLIQLNITVESNNLHLEILDNGIGVNQSISRKAEIEGDHNSKGMEITSKRIELIRKMSNNDIALIGPEEIKDENSLIKGTRVLLKIPLYDLEN